MLVHTKHVSCRTQQGCRKRGGRGGANAPQNFARSVTYTLLRNKLLCQLFGALNGQWFHI